MKKTEQQHIDATTILMKAIELAEQTSWEKLRLYQVAAHRKVTRQIFYGKLEPGHLHVTFPALLRVSRTVQWMREATQRDTHFVIRAIAETALTTIFLLTLCKWLFDESKNSYQTKEFLHQLLRKSSHVKNFIQNSIHFCCNGKYK